MRYPSSLLHQWHLKLKFTSIEGSYRGASLYPQARHAHARHAAILGATNTTCDPKGEQALQHN